MSVIVPQISVKFVANLSRGNKRTIRITGDHLDEENIICKWAIVCTMNVFWIRTVTFP